MDVIFDVAAGNIGNDRIAALLVARLQPFVTEETMADGNNVSRRGFASISPEKQREIASMGGKSVPNEKRSFSLNRDLASEAGRKGGLKSGARRA